jgi:hypothetical protein
MAQQELQLDDQIGGRRDRQEVSSHPHRVGDDHRIAGVGLGFADEPSGHGIDRASGHIHHALTRNGKHRAEKRGLRADDVDAPDHLVAVGAVYQFSQRALIVRDSNRPHNSASVINAGGVMVLFAHIDADP